MGKMGKLLFGLSLFVVFYITGCQDDPLPQDSSPEVKDILQQLLDEGQVTGSLNPFELIDNPDYRPVHELDYMQDDELVFMTRACGFVQVFPHRSMVVEVVNDWAHGVMIAVTYCPITRSGIGWNRIVGEDTLLLTASGYLYRENLMPLDINTGSIWSQMLLQGLTGKHSQEEVVTFPLIETTWKTVREYFPGAIVYVNNSLTKSAGSAPLEQQLGILSRDHVEILTGDMFPGEISLKTTVVNPGGRVVVAGSELHNYMVAFRTSYKMEPVKGEFPVIMVDETGTYWNIFGAAVSGERGGERLESPVYYKAADWAWREQYTNVTVYQD